MKILYLTDQVYLHGGAEKILIQKINYWVEFFDYEVILITTNQRYKKPFFPINKEVKLIDLKINYIDGLSFYNPLNLIKIPKHFKRLKNEVANFKPDAIFVISKSITRFITPIVARRYAIYNEYHTSYYGMYLGYEHSSMLQKIKKKISNCIIKFTEKFYTKIIFLNQEEFDHYKIKNAVIIPNFFDNIKPDINVEKRNIIISLGRLCYQKGYDLLIDAWEIIDKKIDGWELNIYGNGDDFEKLKVQIQAKNFNNPLFLNDAIENVNDKLAESAFYVMSSRFETFPMVLLEAMSNKLPIVSFDSPTGARSIIIDGEDGILAKNDDILDLADKMLLLIKNKKLRERMSNNAFVSVNRFNANVIMGKWNNLIKSNIKNNL